MNIPKKVKEQLKLADKGKIAFYLYDSKVIVEKGLTPKRPLELE